MIFKNVSIASLFIFSPKIFKYIPTNRKCDIEKDVLPKILEAGENMYGYDTSEYVKDTGTPKRLKQVRADYIAGKIRTGDESNKRKAIFLDRDGVINKEVGQLSRIGDLKIYNFALKAIKKINESGYLAVLITNQPMVAKGFMREYDVEKIHKTLQAELGRNGAKLDAIYYCPHHPEKGFVGEVPELKITCNCRKPNTGLIKKAASDFNLNLNESFFIGDSSVDVKTAENAQIKFIGVKTGYGCRDGRYQTKLNYPIYRNVLEAIKSVVRIKS